MEQIEPAGLIVTALVSGAAAALKDTASQALKEAYGSLKHLLRRKLEGNAEAEMALQRCETNPEVWQLPLREELVRTGADRDEGIAKAAELLMGLVDPQGSQVGKYNVRITGPAQGTVIGDHARVTQHFGSGPTQS